MGKSRKQKHPNRITKLRSHSNNKIEKRFPQFDSKNKKQKQKQNQISKQTKKAFDMVKQTKKKGFRSISL